MTGGHLLPSVTAAGASTSRSALSASGKPVASSAASSTKLPPLSNSRSRSLAPSATKRKKQTNAKRNSGRSVDRNNNDGGAGACRPITAKSATSSIGKTRSKSRSSATSASTSKSCPVDGREWSEDHLDGRENVATLDDALACATGAPRRQNTAANYEALLGECSASSDQPQPAHHREIVPLVKRRDSLHEGLVRRCDRINRVDGEDTVMARYRIDSCLGQGNFAVVSRCTDNDDQSVWALKEVEVAQLNGATYCIENEAALMFLCNHVNIVHLREVFLTPSTYYLIMEVVDNGDLFDAIKREGPFSEPMVASMVHDAACALKYLHKHKIVHRDIKPENLLLTGDYRLKLADFGLACIVQGALYRVCGTPTYVAPEILSETGYGIAVDIWSLGIIMHILFCGYAPFRSSDREKLFELIKGGALSCDSDALWQHVSSGAKRLLRRLLQVDVNKRVTAKKLLASKWLKAQKCRLRPTSAYDAGTPFDLVITADLHNDSQQNTVVDAV